MSDLFVNEPFTSHSGLELSWKIECDALSDDSLRTLAFLAKDHLQPYQQVYGIPRGGTRLAEYMSEYCQDYGGVLIVDDVLTTGRSMTSAKKGFTGGQGVQGLVIFDRSAFACPDWIKALFSCNIP